MDIMDICYKKEFTREVRYIQLYVYLTLETSGTRVGIYIILTIPQHLFMVYTLIHVDHRNNVDRKKYERNSVGVIFR